MRSFPAVTIRFVLLSLILSSSGCSFFGSVGDAISDGYDNTVSYFNSYYNATRVFDEAESEITAAEKLAGVGGFTDKALLAPATTRQKLAIVIDKCSHILQFYPASALVDDALFLVGKSYYYQGEYLKAERKYSEFLSQYPDSPLQLEVRFWALKTLTRLNEDEQALTLGETLVRDAMETQEMKLSASIYDVLGVLYSRANRHDRSVEAYESMRSAGADDEQEAWAMFRLGEELTMLGRFVEAVDAFEQASQISDDGQLVYRCRLGYVRSLRSAKSFEESVQACMDLLEDYRFIQNAKEIMFERGLSYKEAGQLGNAQADFVEVDTSSGRSEVGAKAAFELGKLYESSRGDYGAARDAYTRATMFPVESFFREAQDRRAAFSRYIVLANARAKFDSLLAVAQTPDSAASDSARRSFSDSLKTLLGRNSYELGEVFYVDIENPDSAVFWFRKALEDIEDSVRIPRILYILAELAQSYPDSGYADSETMYRSIISSYPKSVYAQRAKMQLGIPVETQVTDGGELLYKTAEAKIDSGAFRAAIDVLRQVMHEYPVSPFAAKSSYAIAWLYEYRLNEPDSALQQYQNLVQTYSSSIFASTVRPRIRAIQGGVIDSSGVRKRVLPDEKLEIENERLKKEKVSKDEKGVIKD